MFINDCCRRLDKICWAVERAHGEFEYMDIHSTEEEEEEFQGDLNNPETDCEIYLYLNANGRFSYEIETEKGFIDGVLDLSKEYSDETRLVQIAANKVITELDKLDN